jgi:hypothetical protein
MRVQLSKVQKRMHTGMILWQSIMDNMHDDIKCWTLEPSGSGEHAAEGCVVAASCV